MSEAIDEDAEVSAGAEEGEPSADLDAEEVAEMVGRLADGEEYQDLLEVDGETVEAIEAQAYAFFVNDRLDEAETLAEGLRVLNSQRPFSARLLGEIMLNRATGPRWEADDGHVVVPVGMLEEAKESFEEARRLGESDTLMKYRLGEIELRLGNAEPAYELLEQALESGFESGSEVRDRAQSLHEMAGELAADGV